MFVIALVIASIFSCGNTPSTITFMVWDKDSGEYRVHTQKEVSPDVSFKDIQKPEQDTLTIGTTEYNIIGWTEKVENNKSISTKGEKISDEDVFVKNRTLYALYSSEKLEYTLTFKKFIVNKGYSSEDETKINNVEKGTKLKDIKGLPTQTAFVIGNAQYTLSGWTDLATPSNNTPISGIDGISGETEITSAKTYYAVYKRVDMYEVKFMTYDNASGMYK